MKIGTKFHKAVMGSLATFTVMGTSLAAVALLGVGPAGANAANPQNDTVGTWTAGANGSVNVSLSGTWTWPGQNCSGRYGEGWAVDWWGMSSSSTPNPNFDLTNVSGVSTSGSGGSMTSANTTGNTVTFGGSLGVPKGSSSNFFHVGTRYDGETINSASTCTDTGSGNSKASSGPWSAVATYPSAADIPPQICVNFYDEHGSQGKISGSANDFSTTGDNDNSIDTNAFNPASGQGFCYTWVPGHITGDIFLCSSGSPTTTEVLGGTLSATGNTPVGSTSNPLGSTLVVPGSYDMSGTAPSGYEFVTCGGDSTVNSNTSCSDAVLVPPNGTGHGVCYVQLIPSPPTAPSGGTTTTTTTAPAVVAATTVHTGEPWAGSRPLLLGMLGFGSALLGLGLVQRRRVRITEKA